MIDHFDSFTYNLVHALGVLSGVRPEVLRTDRATVEAVAALRPTHLVLSPGPGRPDDPAWLDRCGPLLAAYAGKIPILGVCLGHQGLGHAFGAAVVAAPVPVHGKARRVDHDGAGLFAGLPRPLVAMRYHSLVVDPDTVPDCLRVTAWSEDGLVMGLAHRDHPTFGVQFHPESIGTPDGAALLANFLRA
ncbi:MAG: aminodeoxychorismate/anthranilate synthase component II [Myxococcota bacterium]